MTRIISGEWRGHTLPVLKRGSVRPTTDRARTIMFDTLRDLRGLAVLDLYSGTGALGFEALSRGANSLVSVDRDREYVRRQKEWIEKHPASFQVYCNDVTKILPKLKNTFDLILADPPYEMNLSQSLVSWIENHLASAGKFVYERNRHDENPIESDILQLEKQKVVAETRIQFYKATKL